MVIKNIMVIMNEKNLCTFICDLTKVTPIQNRIIIEGNNIEKKHIKDILITCKMLGLFMLLTKISFGK
jgi:hypothetical protein